MLDINPYNKQEFEKFFKLTEEYTKLKSVYGENINFEPHIRDNKEIQRLTPREKLSTLWVDACVFYYLGFIDKSKTLHDLGCGMNFFKPYYDVIGYDAENKNADVNVFIDYAWMKRNQSTMDCVIACCSLHFRPIQELSLLVESFSNLLSIGGVGVLLLNSKRMIERSKKLPEDLDSYIRQSIVCDGCEVLSFQFNPDWKDDTWNGDIRLVLKRNA